MSNDIASYRRKSFSIKAARVTPLNIEELAKWCRGKILDGEKEGNFSRQYIKVRVAFPVSDRQTEAHTGDWLVKRNQSFKIYTDKAFHRTFENENGPKITAKFLPQSEVLDRPSPSVMPKKQKLDRDNVLGAASELAEKIVDMTVAGASHEEIQQEIDCTIRVMDAVFEEPTPKMSELLEGNARVVSEEPKKAMTLDELNAQMSEGERTPGEVFRGEG